MINTSDLCQLVLTSLPQNNKLSSLSLSGSQLTLLAAALTAREDNEKPLVLILDESASSCQKISETINSWLKAFNVGKTWHVITDQILEQERSGIVSSSLSQTFHYFLSNNNRSNFLIPAKLLEEDFPSNEAYKKMEVRVNANAKSTPRELSEKLVKSGYSPKIRGEQIDVEHVALPGVFTVTFFGPIIETIVRRTSKGTKAINELVVPPNSFPKEILPLAQMLEKFQVLKPSVITQSFPSEIVYDALHPDDSFPWITTNPEDPTLLDKTLVIFYQNRDRVVNWAKHRKLENVVLSSSPLGSNEIALSNDKVAFLTEKDIFPADSKYSAITHQEGLKLIAELRIGKPAVHADHGIAIYEGLQQREINGQWREYLVLQYAGSDSISVPVEYAHKVTAYLGDTVPELHKLGGVTWKKTKKQAKHDAEKFAKELLNIAGERAQELRTPYHIDTNIETKLDESFAYELTPDQEKVWDEIKNDLAGEEPMDRLVVGDVGFGKTEIAVRAARHVVNNGQQVAMLSPTTLLTQQHFDTFKGRMKGLENEITVLSRLQSGSEQTKSREKIASGQAQIAVGTHALLSKKINWKNLGLIIIDEEQRFGVKQKEILKGLRAQVDILSLSATPIPRTLSMALTGLKELSIISTPPEGRRGVKTFVRQDDDAIIEEALRRELDRGGQAYLVSPRVSKLGTLKLRASKMFPNKTAAIAHGQMPPKELAKIMHQFDIGELDILIASSIIENGIDLANANTIIVTGCTHFGLSDLYQLRGRVGRRSRQGYAYFLYSQSKLTSEQKKRLSALTEASRLGSGWSLAQRDLEIRGAGNLLGAEQSGSVNAIGVQLYLDLIEEAKNKNEAGLRRHDVDIQLPLVASIPPHYIRNAEQRAKIYQTLSRATTRELLGQEFGELAQKYGPPPKEVNNLYLLLELQHVAAQQSISSISSTTISPANHAPYTRLVVSGQAIPDLLPKLSSMGNWTVRENALNLDSRKSLPDLVSEIITALS